MAANFNLSTLGVMLISIMMHHTSSSAVTDLKSHLVDSDGVLTKIVKTLFEDLRDVDPDEGRRYKNTSELIKLCGYKGQEYTVLAGSGYLLNVVRVCGAGTPVLLVHGLLESSDQFCIGGESLACQLAARGYDVWILNCRGTTYSKKHSKLSPDDPTFWKFDFHEIAIEDLPATIDFILANTNKTKVAYVGHSQGTTVAYILLSENPSYCNKISIVVSMAPIAYLSNMFSPLVRIVAANRKAIKILEELGVNQLLPRNKLTKTSVTNILCMSPLTAVTVDVFLFLIWGISFAQIDPVNLQSQIGHLPAGGSIRQMLHYLQLVESGHFRQYDHGKEKNMRKYGLSEPPRYRLERITCKMAFFYSDNDWLSSRLDLDKLTSQLPNVVEVHTMAQPLNHQDFFWARDVGRLVNSEVIRMIQRNEEDHLDLHGAARLVPNLTL